MSLDPKPISLTRVDETDYEGVLEPVPMVIVGEMPGGDGGGAVDSVNGKTGSVVLNASDVGAATPASVNAAIAAIPNPEISDVSGLTAALDGKATVAALGAVSTVANAAVPSTRTVAGKALSTDVTLNAGDVGARANTWQPAVADISATGTASATTYLRGDGTWTTPPNTTYTVISQANAQDPSSTASGLASGQRISQGVAAFLAANPVIPEAPATGTYNLQSVDGVVSWVEAE